MSFARVVPQAQIDAAVKIVSNALESPKIQSVTSALERTTSRKALEYCCMCNIPVPMLSISVIPLDKTLTWVISGFEKEISLREISYILFSKEREELFGVGSVNDVLITSASGKHTLMMKVPRVGFVKPEINAMTVTPQRRGSSPIKRERNSSESDSASASEMSESSRSSSSEEQQQQQRKKKNATKKRKVSSRKYNKDKK